MGKILVYMPLSWPTLSSKVFQSFLELTSAENQEKLKEMGHSVQILISDTFPLCRNRNEAVEKAMSNQIAADYIFFADADQLWPKDTLIQMVSKVTDDTPVVTGLYWRKSFPHTCVVGHYSPWDKNMELKRKTIEDNGFLAPDGSQCLYYRPLTHFDLEQNVDVAGMGCVMVRTDVFKSLSLPYFQYINCYTTGGDYTIQHCSEEMVFWAQLKKKGIKTLLLPSIKCGHVTEKVIICQEQ